MPIQTTQQLLEEYLRGRTRPSRIPIFQTGGMQDEDATIPPFETEPQPPIKFTTPEGYTAIQPTPKQQSSDMAAQTEARRGLAMLSTAPGGIDEAAYQYQQRLPEASSGILTPIFDVLQSGQFASAGAVQELVRGGTAWDAFKRAAIEFANAMPFIDLSEYGATRPSYSDVLKDLNVFSEDGYGPWGSAVGGFILDIALDPMTYVGAPIAKGIIKGARGAVSAERAAQIRKLAPVDWFRKAFIPDVAIKDIKYAKSVPGIAEMFPEAEKAGEKYLGLRNLSRAQTLGEVDTMRDTVTQLASGLTPEERRLLLIYLDQPKRLQNLVLSVSTDNETRQRLMQKMTAFRSHYLDLAQKESEVGLLDPVVWRSNYIAGRDPTTKLSAKAWEQFAAERGLKSQITQNLEQQGIPTLEGAAVTGGRPPSRFSRPVQGAATPTFQQAKTFNTIEERIAAAVPTELDIGLATAQRSIEHVREMSTKRLMDVVLSEPSIARRLDQDSLHLLESRQFHDALKEHGYGIMDAPHWERGTAPYILPMPIIEDLRKANTLFSDSKEMAAFFRQAQTITSWWKGWALFSPGYHMRNMYSNIFQNWLADVKNPTRYAQSLAAMSGMEGEIVTKAGERIPFAKILEEMKQQGVYKLPARDLDLPRQVEDELIGLIQRRQAAPVGATGDLATAVAASAAQGGSMGVMDVARAAGRAVSPSGAILRWNQRAGSTIEDVSRVAHFIDKRVKGLNPDLAARSVRKYLFDYNELTSFQKNYVRPLFPFATWLMKNIPLQIEALVTNPGKYARIPKLKQAIESVSPDWENIPTPDYFTEIVATRLPKGVSEAFGGEPVYLNPNLPFQDLNHFNYKDILSQMNPFVKFMGEWGSGYSTFLDRPIEKYPGEIEEGSPLGLSKKAEYFVQALVPPYGKVAKIVKSASPQKDVLGEQLLTEGAGIKLIGVDVEAVRRAKNLKMRDAVRSAIDKMRDEGWLPPARMR